MNNMFSNQTQVRSLIKFRPLAIGLLDKRRVRFWDALDRPIADVFHREGMQDFLEEVSYTSVPAPDTDWTAMPLYMLVDYLTHEHRNFFVHEIADIRHLLDIHTLADSAEALELKGIHRDFNEFVHEFQGYIDEEEGFLFPKILRYEACLRDRSVHPEFHRGSLQSYMATPKAQRSQKFYTDFAGLTERVKIHALSPSASGMTQELAEFFRSLLEKLQTHRALETEALFGVARELERSLYNLSIDGDPTVRFNRRGPMDSGIMRLDEG